jgi:hypothetical protein
MTKKANEFKVGNHVVYPTHGVGKITAEETQKIGDVELNVFVISFEKDKMTLRVPVHRAAAAKLRNISSDDEISKAFMTLKGRARISRGMWSRHVAPGRRSSRRRAARCQDRDRKTDRRTGTTAPATRRLDSVAFSPGRQRKPQFSKTVAQRT